MLTLALLLVFAPVHARPREILRDAAALRNEVGAAAPAEIVADAESLVGRYDPGSRREREAVEVAVRRAAVGLHADFKALRSGPEAAERARAAEALYGLYLLEFSESENAGDMRYAFGELLYAVKKYDAAYEQYMAVARMSPPGSHTKFCVESAIATAEEMRKSEEEVERGSLSPWSVRALEAMDLYLDLYPGDPSAQRVAYRAAWLQYDAGQYLDSGLRFRAVIVMNPSTREAEMAANLLLDGLSLSRDWRGLRDMALVLYEMEELGSADFKKEVFDVAARASCQIGEPLPGTSCEQ